MCVRFKVGDRVEFQARGEQLLQGTVKKINRKRLSIDVGQLLPWLVPPGMLRKLS